jgi:hypothetical protein
MAFQALRFVFKAHSLSKIPVGQGVYILWTNEDPIFAGCTALLHDTLEAAIRRHLQGNEQPGYPRVTHFSFEITSDPLGRHYRLVAALKALRPGF